MPAEAASTNGKIKKKQLIAYNMNAVESLLLFSIFVFFV